MPDGRPSPADLLLRAQREQSRSGRGQLKVFLGMAPGVGKTYAMLATAQRLARDGIDVVAGIVETHGRTETEQLLLGLDILPRRAVDHRGAVLEEFDLDAALRRRPEVLLLDELAHSNAPGSRFEKRWQDALECRAAGIAVLTTLNVQHVESLNDVVAQITGVRVRETVPDAVLEEADDIELVDLAPDALLERLRAGRVYVPESAREAADSFFRKGNLTALRELALRATAERVDAQMRGYKAERGIREVWPASERVLVAVSASPSSAKLVRAARRMAAGLRADLIAAYVETRGPTRPGGGAGEQAMRNLRLAESLGAETATLGGRDAAAELVAFARSRNVSRIVVGKTGRSRWRERLLGSFVDDVIRGSGEIDISVISGEGDGPEPAATSGHRGPIAAAPARWLPYLGALAVVAATAGVSLAIWTPPDRSEESMVLLGGVVLAALRFGRGPGIAAAVAAVLAFNVLFTEPRFTVWVDDPASLVTFAVMLAVGVAVGSPAARAREHAALARAQERRTSSLYAMTRALSAARTKEEVAAAAVRHVRDTFDADAALVVVAGVAVVAGGAGAAASLEVLATSGSPDWLDERERGVARWALDHGRPAGLGTQVLPSALGRHLPLRGSQGTVGALCVRPTGLQAMAALEAPERLLLLDTFANQAALALERVALIEGRQAAELAAESERLRSALLSSVSHDLRTPLATIAGAASVLREPGGVLDEATRRELAESVVSEAERLNGLIANLVFATRLEAPGRGGIELRRDWTTVEEIVGAGLAPHRVELERRSFRVRLASELPLLHVDEAMLPQVISNLVDNALQHTPPATPIDLTAWATDTDVVVRVADQGPGLGEGESTRVFERFYRSGAARFADGAAVRGGMGLGLTICQGIVTAHGGRIWAEPNQPHGVAFVFSLPIERPQPPLPTESEGRDP